MPSKGRRSDSHRTSRSDRRHAHRSRSSASDIISAPSTSVGRTSSTSITSPSDDTPMDLDPYLSSAQSQANFGVAAFASYPQTGASYSQTGASYPQTGFGPPQPHPGQGSHLPTDPNPSHYVAASPEPIDYSNHSDGDDLAASMVVSPGSPPPPRSHRPTMIEEEMTKQELRKNGRTTRSHTREPSAVLSWRPDPSNILPPQGGMEGGYQPYSPNLVDAFGYQPRSPYPLAIDEADMYDDPNVQAGNEPENAAVNHWYQDAYPDQNQEDEWVWVGAQVNDPRETTH